MPGIRLGEGPLVNITVSVEAGVPFGIQFRVDDQLVSVLMPGDAPHRKTVWASDVNARKNKLVRTTMFLRDVVTVFIFDQQLEYMPVSFAGSTTSANDNPKRQTTAIRGLCDTVVAAKVREFLGHLFAV